MSERDKDRIINQNLENYTSVCCALIVSFFYSFDIYLVYLLLNGMKSYCLWDVSLLSLRLLAFLVVSYIFVLSYFCVTDKQLSSYLSLKTSVF